MAYDSLHSASDFVEVNTGSIGAGVWQAAPEGVRYFKVMSGQGSLVVKTTGSKNESRTLTLLVPGDLEPLQVTEISGDSQSMRVRLYK